MMIDFVRLTLGAVLLLFLPGAALLAVGRKQLQLDWVETLCMASGLSLAAVPLLLYATTLIGLRQGPLVVWALLAICAVVVMWDWRSARTDATWRTLGQEQRWVYAALAIVLVFTLVSRLWVVRNVDFPSWTDSYGHAVIAQMVIDQGGVPTTYAPYAPITDFTYHFGVHALTAWYFWITGVPMLQGMVVLGQLLNVLVVPTTYLFATRLFDGRDTGRVAGLAATVVVALISHMPAQFVNWGRFTQLDGQMLLPIAVVLYLALLRSPAPRYRVLGLTVAAFAGLFVAHYRVFLFGVMLAGLLWGGAMLTPPTGQSRGRLLRETSLVTLLGLLILAPWLWRLAQGFGGNFATQMVGYEEQQFGTYYFFDPKELLNFGMHAYLWVLAVLGALWGLWRRKGMVLVLLLWMVAAFAGANLYFLNMTPLYSNTIFIIMLYLPLVALIGYLVQEVAAWGATRWAITPGLRQRLALGVVLVLLGAYAVENNARMFAPENIFVREGDLQAVAWIEQEIPEDALFYIATAFWTPEVAHGLDGGYYLPLLAARQTIMPPQHYASDGSGDYRALINQRLRDLDAAQDADALWRVLQQYAITHVYIGVRGTPLDPAFFAARPDLFVPLYEQAGVWIFQVNEQGNNEVP